MIVPGPTASSKRRGCGPLWALLACGACVGSLVILNDPKQLPEWPRPEWVAHSASLRSQLPRPTLPHWMALDVWPPDVQRLIQHKRLTGSPATAALICAALLAVCIVGLVSLRCRRPGLEKRIRTLEVNIIVIVYTLTHVNTPFSNVNTPAGSGARARGLPRLASDSNTAFEDAHRGGIQVGRCGSARHRQGHREGDESAFQGSNGAKVVSVLSSGESRCGPRASARVAPELYHPKPVSNVNTAYY